MRKRAAAAADVKKLQGFWVKLLMVVVEQQAIVDCAVEEREKRKENVQIRQTIVNNNIDIITGDIVCY